MHAVRVPSTRPARPLRLRLLLFLYGNGNLLGSALALLGPGLLFAGVIGPGWLAITAGLYGAGWLLGHAASPPPAAQTAGPTDELDAAGTLAWLDALLADYRAHLPADAAGRLASLRATVAEVLPRLCAGASYAAELHTVRETVLRYLPETLANYVALPPLFRSTHPLRDGQTARELLSAQLGLLDDTLRELAAGVATSDAQALLANGRFLEARFRQADFLEAR